MSVDPDRIARLHAYACERITQCRREEARIPSALDAAQERRTLVAVLEMLGLPVPERDERELRLLAESASERRAMVPRSRTLGMGRKRKRADDAGGRS